MELRRSVFAGMTGANYNILKNCTFSPGFLNNDGTVTAPNQVRLEVYLNELVEVTSGELVMVFTLNNHTLSESWMMFCLYDADRHIIKRDSLFSYGYNYNAHTIVCFRNSDLPAGTVYIRPTFRTYGDADICILYASDMKNAIQQSGTKFLHSNGQ